MYFKGSLMLHTLRTLINDDKIWFEILMDIANNFRYKIIDGQDIINYINNKVNKDFSYFFNQYLNYNDIPEFEYAFQKEGRNITLICKWNTAANFNMPLLINLGKEEDIWIYPTNDITEIDLGSFDKPSFHIRDDLFYIDVKKK